MALPEENPIYGPFFGVMGAAAAIIFSGKLKISAKSRIYRIYVARFHTYFVVFLEFRIIFRH